MAGTKGQIKGVKGHDINKEQFEKLCQMMCTKEEICSFFGVAHDTLEKFCKQNYGDTYLHVFKTHNDIGKVSLRRLQMKHAEKNPTMAIWLGKQYLGQKDYVEQVTEERITVVDDVKDDEEV